MSTADLKKLIASAKWCIEHSEAFEAKDKPHKPEGKSSTPNIRMVQALTWNCVVCDAYCIIDLQLLNVPFVYTCPDHECQKRYLVDLSNRSVREE